MAKVWDKVKFESIFQKIPRRKEKSDAHNKTYKKKKQSAYSPKAKAQKIQSTPTKITFFYTFWLKKKL